MSNLILAIQFLTRIPININIDTKENSFAESVAWFPVVGLLVGAFNSIIYWLSSQLLDGMFPIVCAVLANVCITGALHVDGIADTCDGIFSARKRERMLEIMKDSRIGTHGALAIVFDILARVAIMTAVSEDKLVMLLIAAPIASRTLLPLIMKLSVYARAEGMGGLFLGKQGWSRTIIALFLGILLIGVIFGYTGIASLTAAAVILLLFRSYIYSKLRGMTGDTIGASNEIAEVVFMMAAAVIWRQLL